MMMFGVIKSAEIPRKIVSGGRPPKYPFPALEIGDGFEAPRDMGRSNNRKVDKRARSMRVAANLWAKRNNPAAKFTVITVNENTVRCVRIA